MTDAVSNIEALINQGRYFEARSLAQNALKTSDSLRLKQLLALAVSKAGVPKAAVEILEPVYRERAEDPETAGIMGGIYKEIFRKDQDAKYAVLSRDTYLKNFTTTRNYYTGINAATMSAISGQVSKGREIAAEVIQLIGQSPNDFWQQVTLAEALLLTRERDKSVAAYFEAKKMAGTDWGKISTVYNQLWLMNHYVPVPKEVLRVFNPPGVVSFIGHMIDHPTRPKPRFPSIIENQVRDAIASAINTLNAKIGFCSLACGSDILFAETMAAAGGEVNIWLPFAKEDFIEASVRFAGGDWLDRFNRLMDKFPVNYITHEPYAGFDDLFSFQNRVIFGSAIIRGTMNHTEPTLMTVLSETDLKLKEGGTRDTLNLWPFPGRHVNINPDNYFSPSSIPPPTVAREEVKAIISTIDRPVLYGVAADLPGMNAEEQRKVWADIREKLDLPILAPVTFESDNTLIVSFRSILGAMDLAKVILREMRTHFLSDRLRMSLYASPVLLEPGPEEKQKQIALTTKGRLLELHSLVPSGAVFAFARFSSALSLDVNHYSVDYAGMVTTNWFPQPLEIFKVNLMDGPKRPA
ncbi:MAG: DUF4071 domain-containing protein [Cyclobacteriaceae bacterium]|nr:DUF4071 domain-containing protein [Cyclobacteriaceae bacterium]